MKYNYLQYEGISQIYVWGNKANAEYIIDKFTYIKQK